MSYDQYRQEIALLFFKTTSFTIKLENYCSNGFGLAASKGELVGALWGDKEGSQRRALNFAQNKRTERAGCWDREKVEDRIESSSALDRKREALSDGTTEVCLLMSVWRREIQLKKKEKREDEVKEIDRRQSEVKKEKEEEFA
ncbi:hypothetical protein Ancab_026029 [Ancistrocladus abbreviatus]